MKSTINDLDTPYYLQSSQNLIPFSQETFIPVRYAFLSHL